MSLFVEKVGFTGHRDGTTDEKELDKIRLKYPKAVWVHGGAVGFDTQVKAYAEKHGITQDEILPDYETFKGNEKAAPKARNQDIVNKADVLYACYDGRKFGGTYDAIVKARRRGIDVKFISYIKNPIEEKKPGIRIPAVVINSEGKVEVQKDESTPSIPSTD